MHFYLIMMNVHVLSRGHPQMIYHCTLGVMEKENKFKISGWYFAADKQARSLELPK
jgi:hypothetical protein